MANLISNPINLAPMLLEEAFPEVDPGRVPLGPRVMVQLRLTKKKTQSGLYVVEETRQDQKWNCQVGKVVALGPIAFCNRETGKPWPEGAWISIGDFVIVPRWGGNRHEVDTSDHDESIQFVTWNDHEIISRVTGDPLRVKEYLL